MPVGIRVHTLPAGDDRGIRIQFSYAENQDHLIALWDNTADGGDNAINIVVVPGVGDPRCLQCLKVDEHGVPN